MSPTFITFVTPSYKRPKMLAACMASVGAQTLIHEIEHLVLPDHIGIGIEGMYAKLPQYASAVHGEYVHLLADDDVLADEHVVGEVKAFAELHGYPPVIIVEVVKHMEQGALCLPLNKFGPPVEGAIDLGCVITRNDVWKQHVGDYGKRYEGDADHLLAMWNAGHKFAYSDVYFLEGAVMRGRPE
jgi:hypothetical protein